jgi:hypothetical protein
VKSKNSDQTVLKRMLQATAECIPAERIGDTRTAAESEHVNRCARCQTEIALWQDFNDATPVPDEGAAVQWVVAELRRRRQAPPAARAPYGIWRWLPSTARLVTAGAALAGVVTIGYVMRDGEPAVRELQDTPQVYRTAQVQVVAPVGDIAATPSALEWVAFSGAAGYDVEVLEVDGTSLWRGTSSSPRIDLPSSVLAQLVPGKTVLWEVRARSASGATVANSGTQRFRVEVKKLSTNFK